ERVGPVAGKTLRRHVEQTIATIAQAAKNSGLLVGTERAVVEGRRHAVAYQRIDLILHQGDQGRDDEAETGLNEGWRLKAERFAAAGRENDDGVLTGEDRVHGLTLMRAERGIAPIPLDHVEQRVLPIRGGFDGHRGHRARSDAFN